MQSACHLLSPHSAACSHMHSRRLEGAAANSQRAFSKAFAATGRRVRLVRNWSYEGRRGNAAPRRGGRFWTAGAVFRAGRDVSRDGVASYGALSRRSRELRGSLATESRATGGVDIPRAASDGSPRLRPWPCSIAAAHHQAKGADRPYCQHGQKCRRSESHCLPI